MNAHEYREHEASCEEREQRIAREHRFREPSDDEVRRANAEPLLSDRLRQAAWDDNPKLREACEAADELHAFLLRGDITRLEAELERLKTEAGEV